MENSVNMIRVSLAEKLKQQQDEIERLTLERDAAITDLQNAINCGACMYNTMEYGDPNRECDFCTQDHPKTVWRGVCEENSGGEGT